MDGASGWPQGHTTQLYRMQGGQADEIEITFKDGKTRIENIE